MAARRCGMSAAPGWEVMFSQEHPPERMGLIDKALARLVSHQEYERVRATYSPPLIPV
jgi:hypothetical protein